MNEKIQMQALANIQKRRQAAELEYQKKMEPLWADEQYAKLDKERTSLMIQQAKAEAYGDEQTAKMVKEKRLFPEEECAKLEKNLSLFGEKPHYSCKKCNDTGFLKGKMCECLKREISTLLLQESGFSSLEKFEESVQTAGDMQPVYALMKKWCNSNFSKNLVFLAGQPGVGKTHLTKCMANDLIERGMLVKFMTAFAMNQKFCELHKAQTGELADELLEVEVLFIDDLGTEPLYRNITEEYFYLLINERKTRNLPTVISSNLTLEDIQNRYGERVFARIVDRKTSINIYVEGQDRRLQK